MAYTQTIRLPKRTLDAIRTLSGTASVSSTVTDILKQYVSGERTLIKPHQDVTATTTISTDPALIKQVSEHAKALNLPLNQALVLMLDQATSQGEKQ